MLVTAGVKHGHLQCVMPGHHRGRKLCGRQQVLLHVLLAGSAAEGILAVQCMSVVVAFGIMVDGTLRWCVQLFHGFAAQPGCPSRCCKRHADAVAVGRVGRQLTVPVQTEH